MVYFEEIKGRFKKGSDYTVSYKNNGKTTIYNIVSPELKKILFADEVRRGIDVPERDCSIEQDRLGNEIKSYVVDRVNYDSLRVDNSGLFFKPFLDNVRLSIYDDSGRLLTDPAEIQEEVEKRRRGESKAVNWKKGWRQLQVGGRVDNIEGDSSSRMEEITESSDSSGEKGKERIESSSSPSQQRQEETKESQGYNEWLKQGKEKGWLSILVLATLLVSRFAF